MAAYTKQDVLNTLADPALQKISLYADSLWINGGSFSIVRDHVLSSKISVAEGNQTIAGYNSAQNRIITQLGSSPPDEHARGLLVHECTHALMDVYKFRTSMLTNELLCYITQHIYLLHKIPGYNSGVNMALDPVSQDYLWQDFYFRVLNFARRAQFGLFAIDTNHWEFKSLRNHLWTLNIYQHLTDATTYTGSGV